MGRNRTDESYCPSVMEESRRRGKLPGFRSASNLLSGKPRHSLALAGPSQLSSRIPRTGHKPVLGLPGSAVSAPRLPDDRPLRRYVRPPPCRRPATMSLVGSYWAVQRFPAATSDRAPANRQSDLSRTHGQGRENSKFLYILRFSGHRPGPPIDHPTGFQQQPALRPIMRH